MLTSLNPKDEVTGDSVVADGDVMDKDKALNLIDEFLTEPNSISRDWIDCLLYCRECIKKVDELNAEIEHLKGVVNEALGVKL